MCPILRNHINTQSLVIWEIQAHQIYYYTQYSCCLPLIPTPVGWDIMEYKSDPLPYYRWLSNRSYPIIKKFISRSLYLPPHVLAPLPNELTRPWNILRLYHAHLIYGPESNVRHNGGLSLLNVLLDGP